jgi:hypothetical protein
MREGGRREGKRRLEECNRTSVVVLRPGIRGKEIARLIVLALTGLGSSQTPIWNALNCIVRFNTI